MALVTAPSAPNDPELQASLRILGRLVSTVLLALLLLSTAAGLIASGPSPAEAGQMNTPDIEASIAPQRQA